MKKFPRTLSKFINLFARPTVGRKSFENQRAGELLEKFPRTLSKLINLKEHA